MLCTQNTNLNTVYDSYYTYNNKRIKLAIKKWTDFASNQQGSTVTGSGLPVNTSKILMINYMIRGKNGVIDGCGYYMDAIDFARLWCNGTGISFKSGTSYVQVPVEITVFCWYQD